MQYVCPSCGQSGECSRYLAGIAILCKKCHHSIRLPPSGVSPSTPPDAPQSDNEQQRRDEEARLAAERKRKEEEARIAAEQKRRDEEARLAAERKRKDEEARIADQQKRKEEEARIADQQKRKEEEARIADQQKRKEEEARIAAEQKREEEQKRKDEDARIAAEQKRKDEAARIAAEQKRKDEDARIAGEQKRKEDEARAAAEHKRKEDEARAAAEQKRKDEQRRKDEEARTADQKRKDEEARIAAEKRRKDEEARVAAEQKRKDEALDSAPLAPPIMPGRSSSPGFFAPMTPAERKKRVRIIAAVLGSVGLVISLAVSPPAPYGTSLLSVFIGGGVKGVAFAGFGALFATLILPRARLTCPKCGDPNSKPAGQYFVSGKRRPNTCVACGHQWKGSGAVASKQEEPPKQATMTVTATPPSPQIPPTKPAVVPAAPPSPPKAVAPAPAEIAIQREMPVKWEAARIEGTGDEQSVVLTLSNSSDWSRLACNENTLLYLVFCYVNDSSPGSASRCLEAGEVVTQGVTTMQSVLKPGGKGLDFCFTKGLGIKLAGTRAEEVVISVFGSEDLEADPLTQTRRIALRLSESAFAPAVKLAGTGRVAFVLQKGESTPGQTISNVIELPVTFAAGPHLPPAPVATPTAAVPAPPAAAPAPPRVEPPPPAQAVEPNGSDHHTEHAPESAVEKAAAMEHLIGELNGFKFKRPGGTATMQSAIQIMLASREEMRDRLAYYRGWISEGTFPELKLFVLDRVSAEMRYPHMMFLTGPLNACTAFLSDSAYATRVKKYVPKGHLETANSYQDFDVPGFSTTKRIGWDFADKILKPGFFFVSRVLERKEAPPAAPAPADASPPTPESIIRAIESAGGTVKPRTDEPDRGGLEVTVRDCAVLPQLAGLPNIQVLNLMSTSVSDAGLAHIASLKSLDELILNGTGVTDDGLKHLASLTSLRDISLSATLVTDAGLHHLVPLKKLIMIWVRDTRITKPGLDKLAKAAGIRVLSDLHGMHPE